MFPFLQKKKYLLAISPIDWEKKVAELLKSSEKREIPWWDFFTKQEDNYDYCPDSQEISWEVDVSFSPDIHYKSTGRNSHNLIFYLSYEWIEDNLVEIELFVRKSSWYMVLLFSGMQIALAAYIFTRPFSLRWDSFIPYLLIGMGLFAIKQLYTFVYTANFIHKYLVAYLKLIPIEEYGKIEEIGSFRSKPE